MPFDYDHLMSYPVPEAEQRVTPQDCLLYALSLGLGARPPRPAPPPFRLRARPPGACR